MQHKEILSNKIGLPPGSLVHIGEHKKDKVKMTMFDYNTNRFEETSLKHITDCTKCKEKKWVTWVNIDGLHDVLLMQNIGHYFGLHELVLEDIMNTRHRPKAEELDNCLFFTFKMLKYNEKTHKINSKQISFILGKYFLLSFQEEEENIFDSIRESIRKGKGKIRTKKADYLAYLLIDIIMDNYFYIIEQLGNDIEQLEKITLDNPDKECLIQIQSLKKQVVSIRKAIYPLREAVNFIEKGESDFIEDTTLKYFRDLYDHTIQLIEYVELLRDALINIKDIYLSNINNRMNNIMKVLTIMSSIFIPLTFIAGIYGMNFKYIPELDWKWGYFSALSLMSIIAVLMLFVFKKRNWF